jgi:hypothetical protein
MFAYHDVRARVNRAPMSRPRAPRRPVGLEPGEHQKNSSVTRTKLGISSPIDHFM